MVSDREKKLEEILAQFIKPIKNVPFEVVIKALCGTQVRKFDLNKRDNEAILEKISLAMRVVCKAVQDNPINRSRPNEVGNDMEPFVIDALKSQG